jgi:hypothetical protein
MWRFIEVEAVAEKARLYPVKQALTLARRPHAPAGTGLRWARRLWLINRKNISTTKKSYVEA